MEIDKLIKTASIQTDKNLDLMDEINNLALDSIVVGKNCQNELHRQKVQIDRIKTKIEEIDALNTKGEKELNGIEGVIPKISFNIKEKREKSEKREGKKKGGVKGKERNENNYKNITKREYIENSNFKVLDTETREKQHKISNMLDDFSNSLEIINEIALSLGEEIKNQNRELEEVNLDIYKTSEKTRKISNKIKVKSK